MSEAEGGKGKGEEGGKATTTTHLIELVKVLALPIVTLVVGYWFNTSLDHRQQAESNSRLYVEMMGRREEADSNLRKDMFNSILNTFMSKDAKQRPQQQIRQEILSLELLAHNFHESLDIGPLFKDVARRIPAEAAPPGGGPAAEKEIAELRGRLEIVAQEVVERQLTVLSDGGTVERGSALPDTIKNLKAYVMFGANTVPNPEVPSGEGVSRVCLSMAAGASRHYRQFKLEIIDHDAGGRQVYVRLLASKTLSEAECRSPTLDLEGKKEVDTNFWVGLFDFPMIDNTRLSDDERCAVSVTALNPSVLGIALVYFPGSRASLRDRPYLDEVIRDRLDRQPENAK